MKKRVFAWDWWYDKRHVKIGVNIIIRSEWYFELNLDFGYYHVMMTSWR